MKTEVLEYTGPEALDTALNIIDQQILELQDISWEALKLKEAILDYKENKLKGDMKLDAYFRLRVQTKLNKYTRSLENLVTDLNNFGN